jgi:hypothetical protein
MEPQTPLSLFKSRIYDLLTNRQILQPVGAIGTLSREDSALCTALGLTAERFQEETALELAQAAFDGIALTLLTVYRNGLPPGTQMASAGMQQVAEILSKAGEDGRSDNRTENRSDDAAGDAAHTPAAAQSDTAGSDGSHR